MEYKCSGAMMSTAQWHRSSTFFQSKEKVSGIYGAIMWRLLSIEELELAELYYKESKDGSQNSAGKLEL